MFKKIVNKMDHLSHKHPWFPTIFCSVAICLQIIMLVLQLMTK